MESLKDKITKSKIEYEQSDIYSQLIAIGIIVVIVALAVLLVNIDYAKIPIIGLFIDLVIDIILQIINFISKLIRMILDLF